MRSKKEQDELIRNGLAILNFNDKDAELSVISTIIKYNEKWEEVSDILTEDVFYDQRNKAVFKCLKGVLQNGGVADIGALFEYSQDHPEKREALEYYEFLPYNEVNPIAFEQNVARIVRYWQHRKTWELLQIFSGRVQDHTEKIDELLSEIQEGLKNIVSMKSGDTLRSMNEVAKEARELVKINNNGGGLSLKSGYQIIDDAFMLRETTLTIIAAFSSVGKSALAMNIAENVARNGHAVAYYTKEMADVELFMRVAASNIPQSKLSANILLNAQLKKLPGAESKFEQAVRKIENLPIYFDNGATTSFEKTIRSVRDVVRKKGVQLVIIDYLQIFAQTANGSEESALGYMARELKNVAKELKIAVIALSQISRPVKGAGKTTDLHPRMRGLRGSGQLEESADSVILIDRPEVFGAENVTFEGQFAGKTTKEHAILTIAKARAGATIREWLVQFDGIHTQYKDVYDADGNIDPEKNTPTQSQEQQMFIEASNNLPSNYGDPNAKDANGDPLPF